MSDTPRLALDIETVSPHLGYDNRPDFNDPDDFEMPAVGVGYQEAPSEDVETDVLFRRGMSARNEAALIGDTLNWYQNRTQRATSELFTYNGTDFDFKIMYGRACRATQTMAEEGTDDGFLHDVDESLRDWIADLNHTDLKPPVWNAYGTYTRFEDGCAKAGVETPETPIADYNIGFGPEEWRTSSGPSNLTGRDVPQVGKQYRMPQRGALRRAIRATGGAHSSLHGNGRPTALRAG